MPKYIINISLGVQKRQSPICTNYPITLVLACSAKLISRRHDIKRWHSEIMIVTMRLRNQSDPVLGRMQFILSKQQHDAYGDNRPASPLYLKRDIERESAFPKGGC
jgi:hypothetical protein